ncbi:MAG: phospholipid carrier-dependent glycosyltransferase [Kiritimatiellae bacterium]|nr:phospholipid carrier-dependent glycosyltransferase [Kiritimatiellia bacterium]
MNVPERLSTVAVWTAFLAVVVLALVFRVIQLDRRVAHNDEANQIYKTGVLYDTGVYQYDAYEHHGPVLYYLSVPLLKLSGAAGYAQSQLPTYRLLPALFGVGLVLLLLMTRHGLGWGETWVAALLTAVSTGMTYYSRFYIQEILVVFFTF